MPRSEPRGLPLITLLTDFGDRDYYVAAVRGTILRMAPGAALADISHTVDPGDIAHAAFLLAAAAPSFPAGTVHLAVVDPGVGSSRRILAACADTQVVVCPDNGLLTLLLERSEEVTLVSVERSELFVRGPGSTFHGRDRFAPVAAHLAMGGLLESLGPEVTDPVTFAAPPPRRGARRLRGHVLHVDRFGNVVTDLPCEWLPHRPFTAAIGRLRTSRRCSHYVEIPHGELALLCGSLGTLEASMRSASAASACRVEAGEPIQIDFG